MINFTREPSKRKVWSVLDGLIILFSSILAGVLTEKVILSFWPAADPILKDFLIVSIEALVVIILHFYYIEIRYTGLGGLDFRFEKPVWYFQLGIGAGVLCYLATDVLTPFIFSYLGIEKMYDPVRNLVFQADLRWEKVLLIIGFILIIPIMDEVIYRGFIYPAMHKSLGGIYALFFTSMLFAFMQLSPTYFLPYLLAGGLIGLVYEITGSLYTAIIAHVFWNILILATLFLL